MDERIEEAVYNIDRSRFLKIHEETYDNCHTIEHNKISTNIPALDEYLGGGLRFGLHCVTGGPSSYKTAMLLQIAYLAKMDGRNVTYLTDEISSNECWQRLTARKMQVDKIVGDDTREVPSWASLEDVARKAYDDRDADKLESISNAIRGVKYVMREQGFLNIWDMDAAIQSTWEDDCRPFEASFNTRYLASGIRDNIAHKGNTKDVLEFLDYPDLLIIDAVNSLRLFESKHSKDEFWLVRDYMPEPRIRMENIVETLDNFGREAGVAIVGVFHGNRTGTAYHPSMGDFKETSAIEYRAVSAIELVRADDMRWSNHPKAPTTPQGTEAVGLYVLKSRAGQRTEQNKPIWLAADGAHNFIAPLE